MVLSVARPEGVGEACSLGSTEGLRSFVTVDVSTGVTLDAVEEALGVGVLVDDGFVM